MSAQATNRFTACPTCGATGTSIQRTSEEPVSRDPLAYRYLCTACDTVIEGRRVIQADDIGGALNFEASGVASVSAVLGTITAGTILGDLCAKCGERRLYAESAWLTTDPPQQRWTCQACGHREIRPVGIASTPTTIRVEDEAVLLTIDGAARLPAGTVITLTVTVGPGGALSVAPPAAVPAKRYMNGGRG